MSEEQEDWYELHVAGARGAFEALLSALPKGEAYDGEALEAEHESMGERVREAIGMRSDHTLYAAAAAVVEVERQVAAGAELAIAARRGFSRAAFGFRIETPSLELATDLRRTITEWPGIERVELDEWGQLDPEARGLELYAPAHDFEYRASGRVAGPPHATLQLRKKLAATDFVRLGPLEIAF
jgi:hypothetical protein